MSGIKMIQVLLLISLLFVNVTLADITPEGCKLEGGVISTCNLKGAEGACWDEFNKQFGQRLTEDGCWFAGQSQYCCK
jgi:hypothetical protein